MIRIESEILNVGMSKPPKVASRPAGGLRGAVSASAGYGVALRSKKYVSKIFYSTRGPTGSLLVIPKIRKLSTLLDYLMHLNQYQRLKWVVYTQGLNWHLKFRKHMTN